MQIIGIELLEANSAGNFELKVVANERIACIFACSTEHRDMKLPGLSYEDNYGGNALAAMLKAGQLEFRYHSAFSEARVMAIAKSYFQATRVHLQTPFQILYQGKLIGRFE